MERWQEGFQPTFASCSWNLVLNESTLIPFEQAKQPGIQPKIPGGNSYDGFGFQIDSLMSRMQRGTFVEQQDANGNIVNVAVPAHHAQEEVNDAAPVSTGRKMRSSSHGKQQGQHSIQPQQEQDALRAVGISNKLKWQSSMLDSLQMQLQYSCQETTGADSSLLQGVLDLGTYAVAVAAKPPASEWNQAGPVAAVVPAAGGA